jgi:UDP-glucose 4-epimerase
VLSLEFREGTQRILVLGSGTLGRPVVERLIRRGAIPTGRTPIPWLDRRARQSAFDTFRRGATGEEARRLDVLWAAGRASFSSTTDQTRQEWEAFEDTLRFFDALAGQYDDAIMHLMSSAGGLYEGTHVASSDTPPRPVRPYGRLKLAEEQAAAAAGRALHVYRPSSVYADPTAHSRPGLIGRLVGDGATGRTTPIVGALATLRDYVHNGDVGRFVGDGIVSERPGPGRMSMLVSAEPASIFEAVRLVERTLRKRLFLQFRETWNASNITFAAAVRDPGFRPRSLIEGVNSIAQSVRSGAPRRLPH